MADPSVQCSDFHYFVLDDHDEVEIKESQRHEFEPQPGYDRCRMTTSTSSSEPVTSSTTVVKHSPRDQAIHSEECQASQMSLELGPEFTRKKLVFRGVKTWDETERERESAATDIELE